MHRLRELGLSLFGALLLAIASCGGPPPARPAHILDFDDRVVTDLNQQNTGSHKPLAAYCGDTSAGGFLAELRTHSPKWATVPYEWVPVISGPGASITVRTPAIFAAGDVIKYDPGLRDIKFAHPFGWKDFSDDKCVDQSVDLTLDPAYLGLNYEYPGGGNTEPFHVELEAGAWPVDDFGYTPKFGDRALFAGNWIMDCGHPEKWGAEIHPPAFSAFARVENGVTVSHAFANAYRVTQLYTMDPYRVTNFTDDCRYTDRLTKPFPQFLYERIDDMKDLANSKPLEVHGIIEAIDLPPVSWYVCAPQPKPGAATGVSLDAHFMMRTGVRVTSTQMDDIGCFMFSAAMNATYSPMSLTRLDYVWTWKDINAEATIATHSNQPFDVLQKILDGIDKAASPNWNDPATYTLFPLNADVTLLAWGHMKTTVSQSPIIDRYAPLKPVGGGADKTPGFVVDDSQPFPFYGWAHVSWKVPRGSEIVNDPTFYAVPASLAFDMLVNANPPQPPVTELWVQLKVNGPPKPVVIQSVKIIGPDAAAFQISGDDCSGKQVPLGAGCRITVKFIGTPKRNGESATLVIASGLTSVVQVPLTEPGLVPLN